MNETEEVLESLIKCNPSIYKVYRHSNGRLEEVYDKSNNILWCKKYIPIGSNTRRKLCWLCFVNV